MIKKESKNCTFFGLPLVNFLKYTRLWLILTSTVVVSTPVQGAQVKSCHKEEIQGPYQPKVGGIQFVPSQLDEYPDMRRHLAFEVEKCSYWRGYPMAKVVQSKPLISRKKNDRYRASTQHFKNSFFRNEDCSAINARAEKYKKQLDEQLKIAIAKGEPVYFDNDKFKIIPYGEIEVFRNGKCQPPQLSPTVGPVLCSELECNKSDDLKTSYISTQSGFNRLFFYKRFHFQNWNEHYNECRRTLREIYERGGNPRCLVNKSTGKITIDDSI